MKRTQRANLPPNEPSKGNAIPAILVPEEEIDTPNALLNDLVLENIFGHLNFEDLQSCRQVGNCQWLKNLKKAWWSQTKVIFRSNQEIKAKLVDYLSQPEIVPRVTNYGFHHVFLDRTQELTHFWTDIGHSIKHLELLFVFFSSRDNFCRLIFSQCPNLEKLVVGCWGFDNMEGKSETLNPQFDQHAKLKYLESGSEELPIPWPELLSHLPSLQALKVRTSGHDIYKIISDIRQRNQKSLKLKQIEVYGLVGEYDRSTRSVLLDTKLPLESIHIEKTTCQHETFQNILKLRSKTLKELSVRYHGSIVTPSSHDNKEVSLSEPLDKLEKLEVIHCVFTADIFKNIPNVRIVSLEYHHSLHTLLPEAVSNLKINSCTELSIRIHKRNCDEHKQDLEFFMNLFPKVEKLKVIDITNSQFASICERWKGLRLFDCDRLSRVDVTGLLGYDPAMVSTGIRQPNIVDLRDLRYFAMTGLNGMEMNHAHILRKELQGLQKLKKFCLINYKISPIDGNWKNIFAEYRENLRAKREIRVVGAALDLRFNTQDSLSP